MMDDNIKEEDMQRANQTIKDVELYTQFKNNLKKYEMVLDEMETKVVQYKNIDVKSKIDNSKFLKILNSRSIKILYLAMFTVALLLNPSVAGLLTVPIIVGFSTAFMIKIVRALHETFSHIIYVLLFISTGVLLLFYLTFCIVSLFYFKSVWII